MPDKPTTFRAQDVEWRVFEGREGHDRFRELLAARRVLDYVASGDGRIRAEVRAG